MDETMKQFQLELVEVEIEAENLLLARHEVLENYIMHVVLQEKN